MERDMDEISLREIIEIIWNGKWMIILITIIAMLVSGIYSFLVLDPVYNARSTVMVNQPSEEDPPQLSLQAYKEQVENHAIMRSAITKLNLTNHDITINTLREKIETEIIKDTNLIRITVTDNDPKLAAELANTVTTQFVTFISDQSLGLFKKELQYEMKQIDDEIKLTVDTLENVKHELANTPQILVTNKSLSEDAYLQSVVSENNNRSNAETGSIQYKDEHLNPLYISLQQTESNLKLDISKLENKKEEIQQKIEENRLFVEENLSIVSPAIEPEEPIGPRTLLNVAIAGVIGGIASLFIVFVLHYWRSSSTTGSTFRDKEDHSVGTMM
jgi:succinoglycan biosynthesis transport protein ExoP